MTGNDQMHTDLRRYFREVADDRPAPGQLDAVLARTLLIRPRPAWLVGVRGLAVGSRTRAILRPMPRLAAVGAVVLILALLLVALLVGQHQQRRGGLLAFSRDGVVYLAQPDGSGAVRVARKQGSFLSLQISAPAWSPDGRYLAIDSFDDGTIPGGEQDSPAVMALDSRTLQLSALATGSFLGWTADGRVAVAGSTSSRSGSPTESLGPEFTTVSILAVDGPASRVLSAASTDRPFGPAVVSPDGRWLAAMSAQFLVRIDVATGESVVLYENGAELVDQNGAELVDRPAWSPDSSRIAFARTLEPGCHTCLGPILVVGTDGSLVGTLGTLDHNELRPRWSPDGSWISFVSGGPESRLLEIARPDGSERRSLGTGIAFDHAWSPDGKTVRYLSQALDDAGSRYSFWEVPVAGGSPMRLDDGTGVDAFSWQSLPGGAPIPVIPSAALR